MAHTDEIIKQATDLRNNGNGTDAARLYLSAAEQLEVTDRADEAIECLYMAGVSYKVANDIDTALIILHQTAERFRATGNKVGQGRVFRDIGICHAYRNEYDDALEWTKKSAEALSHTEARGELGISQAKVGAQHMQKGSLDSADEWIERGLASIRSEGPSFYEMTALLHKGDLRTRQERWEEATEILWAAMGIIAFEGGQMLQGRRVAQIYGLLAHAYFGLGNPGAATKLLQDSLKIIEGMPEEAAAVLRKDIRQDSLEEKIASANQITRNN